MSSSVSSPGTPAATRTARLSGASRRLDPRVNAVREDLADLALAGVVVAPRYAAAVSMRGRLPALELRASPSADAPCVSELLWGEGFAVFDRRGEWAWGQCATDAYVGWVRAAGLVAADGGERRAIGVPQALLFAAPSIKAPVLATLPLGARVAVGAVDGDFHAADGGFIHRCHLAAPIGDPATLALSFTGTPYRWGGRTRDGLDCSGLTQAVLQAHGIACPRDSDQQQAAFPQVAFAARRRGDLVCFPGHVGILVDPDTLLHANAHHMTTLAEPLADVVARLQPLHAQPVSATVRPPCGAGTASL